MIVRKPWKRTEIVAAVAGCFCGAVMFGASAAMPELSGGLKRAAAWAGYVSWFVCFFAVGYLTWRRPELRRGFRPPR